MDVELIELGRELSGGSTSPVCFQVGRLQIINAGSGWIKINIMPEAGWRECESELLPPEHARNFIDWLSTVRKK